MKRYNEEEKRAIVEKIVSRVSAGDTIGRACKESGICDASYKIWKKALGNKTQEVTTITLEKPTVEHVILRNMKSQLRSMMEQFSELEKVVGQ